MITAEHVGQLGALAEAQISNDELTKGLRWRLHQLAKTCSRAKAALDIYETDQRLQGKFDFAAGDNNPTGEV